MRLLVAAASPRGDPAEPPPPTGILFFRGKTGSFWWGQSASSRPREKRQRGELIFFLFSIRECAFLLLSAPGERNFGSALGEAPAGQGKGLTPEEPPQKIGGGGRGDKREALPGWNGTDPAGTGSLARPGGFQAAEDASENENKSKQAFVRSLGAGAAPRGLSPAVTGRFNGKGTVGADPAASQSCSIPTPQHPIPAASHSRKTSILQNPNPAKSQPAASRPRRSRHSPRSSAGVFNIFRTFFPPVPPSPSSPGSAAAPKGREAPLPSRTRGEHRGERRFSFSQPGVRAGRGEKENHHF